MLLALFFGAVCMTSCKKLPEQVIVYGQVTNEDGQPFEGVRVSLLSNPSYLEGWLNSTDWYTDENGCYELVFEPESATDSHHLSFAVNKDDYWYRYDCSVSIWKAKQEINVVLKKWD